MNPSYDRMSIRVAEEVVVGDHIVVHMVPAFLVGRGLTPGRVFQVEEAYNPNEGTENPGRAVGFKIRWRDELLDLDSAWFQNHYF